LRCRLVCGMVPWSCLASGKEEQQRAPRAQVQSRKPFPLATRHADVTPCNDCLQRINCVRLRHRRVRTSTTRHACARAWHASTTRCEKARREAHTKPASTHKAAALCCGAGQRGPHARTGKVNDESSPRHTPRASTRLRCSSYSPPASDALPWALHRPFIRHSQAVHRPFTRLSHSGGAAGGGGLAGAGGVGVAARQAAGARHVLHARAAVVAVHVADGADKGLHRMREREAIGRGLSTLCDASHPHMG
jgi:hypothetical protein